MEKIMRIAIIEDNIGYRTVLGRILDEFEWQIDFFSNSIDFGKVNLHEYNIIVSSFTLPGITGYTLLKSIAEKTDAELILMSSKDRLPVELNDMRINSVVNKTEPKDVVEALQYAETKIKINGYMNLEKENFKNILNTINGNGD